MSRKIDRRPGDPPVEAHSNASVVLGEQTNLKDFLSSDIFEVLPLILFLVGTFTIFAIFADGFLTVSNLLNVLRQISYSTILALGLGIIIIGGGIDLSVGSIAALVGIVSAASLAAGINTYMAILLGLLAGVACGFVNGTMVAYIGIPPFIMTLALGFVNQGIIFTWTKGYPIYDGFTDLFLFIGIGYLFNIPTPVILMLVFLVIAYIFISKTSYGRYIYALGNNEESLRVCGINTKKIRLLTYILSGFLSAVAGIVMTARMQSGQPAVGMGGGLTLLLNSITGILLGGIELSGGKGSLLGILAGTLFIGILTNGLTILGFGTYRLMIIIGLALMAALAWNILRVKK